MTAPITAERLAQCRELASRDYPEGTQAHTLVAAIRDLGSELERQRAAMRGAPSVEAVLQVQREARAVRSGREICKFHRVELTESRSCTGCMADGKAARDQLDTTPPPNTPARPEWRRGVSRAAKRPAGPPVPDSTLDAYAAARIALDALDPDDVETALVAACAELGQHAGAQAIAIRAAEVSTRTRPLEVVTGA